MSPDYATDTTLNDIKTSPTTDETGNRQYAPVNPYGNMNRQQRRAQMARERRAWRKLK